MIKTIASVSMPVLEKLEIKKNRLESGNSKKKSAFPSVREFTGMSWKGSMYAMN